MKLAIPSVGAGGLEAERSGHFGHCDSFTLVDIADGEITGVVIIENPPHEQGGCLQPVQLLAGHGVTALIVAGMGGRPLQGFNDVNIVVYFENQTPKIADAVDIVIRGDMEIMDARFTCQGH